MKGPGWGIVALIAAVCVFGGGALGFFIGIATSEFGKEFFEGATMVEVEADVNNRSTIDHGDFYFQYPGNWTLDTEDAYFDPDHYYYIETSGGSYVTVSYENFEQDTDVLLADQMTNWEDYLHDEKSVAVNSSGMFEGSGISVSGRIFGNDVTYEIFCYSDDQRSFVITKFYYDMDWNMVESGFDLVEQTFKLK